MIKKIHIVVLLVFLLSFFNYPIVYAHSGRIDANGGHRNSKTGIYHYHTIGSSSSSQINNNDDDKLNITLTNKQTTLKTKQDHLMARLDQLEKDLNELKSLKSEIDTLSKELLETYNYIASYSNAVTSIPYISTELIKVYLPSHRNIFKENASIWELNLKYWESDLISTERELDSSETTLRNIKPEFISKKSILVKKRNEYKLLGNKNKVQLQLNWKNYKKLTNLSDVPVDKKFLINFSEEVDFSTINNQSNELIDLLNNKNIPLDFLLLDVNKVQIIPKENLYNGGSYLLVIHNTNKSKRGYSLSPGITVEICVVN